MSEVGDILNGVIDALDRRDGHVEGGGSGSQPISVHLVCEDPAPLHWTGDEWTRDTRVDETLDPYMNRRPAQPIGVGWMVASMTEERPGFDFTWPREGLCVDCYVNDDGEMTYVCVERWEHGLWRLDVPASEVRWAKHRPHRARDLFPDVAAAFTKRPHVQLHGDRHWWLGVMATLERLAPRKGRRR